MPFKTFLHLTIPSSCCFTKKSTSIYFGSVCFFVYRRLLMLSTCTRAGFKRIDTNLSL